MDKKRKEQFYPDVHPGCRICNPQHIKPLTDIRVIKKNECYERKTTDIELVFVVSGEILLSTGGYSNIPIGREKLFLLPSGKDMFALGVEEALLFICRLDGIITLCETFPMKKMIAHKLQGDFQEGFAVLPVKHPLGGYVKNLMDFIEIGLRCKRYLCDRIDGIVCTLVMLYTLEELGALFASVVGMDMMFVNHIFSKLKKNANVDDLVVGSGLTRKTFSLKFKKIMGNTPKRFMNNYKIESILYDLAYSHLSIKELSFEYGFPSVVRFSQFCSKYMGAPPGKIRKTK